MSQTTNQCWFSQTAWLFVLVSDAGFLDQCVFDPQEWIMFFWSAKWWFSDLETKTTITTNLTSATWDVQILAIC
jgi:hypothetical protein